MIYTIQFKVKDIVTFNALKTYKWLQEDEKYQPNTVYAYTHSKSRVENVPAHLLRKLKQFKLSFPNAEVVGLKV